MRVNELAKQLGVTADTVRFYTRNKILNPQKNKENGYKNYQSKDVSRLRFVLSARQLGFSVEDIREILTQADNAQSPCLTVRHLIKQRLVETEQRFLEMKRLRDRMAKAVEQWDKMPDKTPSGHEVCHLIENFSNVMDVFDSHQKNGEIV